ncbi:MAG: hypothetical protein M0Z90_06460, partial [Desulfobacteraceae bacterium]|nr:hypothetical protein [Desulfobacteraceae bacterium]
MKLKPKIQIVRNTPAFPQGNKKYWIVGRNAIGITPQDGKGELRKARELASIAKARQRAKKKVPCLGQGTLGDKFGGDLLSRQVTLAVPSAL